MAKKAVKRTYDRVPSPDDPRAAAYRIRDVVQGLLPRSFTWACDAYLDQGAEGACVGFGWAHDAAAKPAAWPDITNAVARADYLRAKVLDEYAGEDYEGTSVNAGAKVSRERGRISAWLWASSIDEVILAVGHHGPVVLGIDWLAGMEDPDADGFIHATGPVRGGHCLIGRSGHLEWLPGTTPAQKREPGWLNRLDLDRSYFTLRNSWGKGWGDNGDAKISVRDLNTLLQQGGEACLPQRLPVRR